MKQLLFIFSFISTVFFHTTLSAAGDITSGLVAHYEFEDDLSDSIGSSDGNQTGTITYSSSGKIGKSAVFDGSSYIDSIMPSTMSEGTISFWVKHGSPTNPGENILKLSDNLVFIVHDTKDFDVNGDVTLTPASVDPLWDGSWHHIAVTFNSTTDISIYKDGILLSSTTPTADRSTNNTVLQLGTNGGGLNYTGEMDDIRIYDRALTDTDVNALYSYQPPKLTLKVHGGALQFNGDTSYVSLPTINGITTNNAITIEAWVNTQLIDGNWHHIFRQDGTNSDLQYGLRFDTYNSTKSINMYINSNGVLGQANFDITADLNSYTNTWKHISGTYDGSNIKIYVDGILKNTTAYSETLLEPSGTATIGSFLYDSVSHFNGSIDEVRVWNVTKTQTQIQDNMNHQLDGNETGLMTYYNFDERVGDSIYDITSNNNDGTIDGNVTRLNFLGDGLEFTSPSDKINIGRGSSDELAIIGDLSICSNIKVNSIGGTSKLMTEFAANGETSATNVLYMVDVYTDGTIRYKHEYGSGTDYEIYSTKVLNPSQWYNICVVRDSTDTKIYIDGKLDSTHALTNSPTGGTSASLIFGEEITTGAILDGTINEISIWNKVLNESEIKQNISSVPDISDSSLVGYWPLNEGLNAISYISDGSTNANTTDIIPTLTSHTSSSEGTAIGDDFSDHYVWEVFDNEIDGTTAEADVWANGACFGAPCHVGFVFNSAKVINKYTITARASGIQSPKYITLQGSHDGTTNWIDLETQRYETTWGDSEKRTFSLINSTPYKGYRVAVENDISDYTAIAELEFIEADAQYQVYDKTSNSNDGTITGATWINTAPEIYGDTIYTSQNIGTMHQLVVENNSIIPTYSYNGGVPSEVVDFNGTTGTFGYINTNETNTTLHINASAAGTNLNTLFDVVVYQNSNILNLELTNINLSENNITNIQIIGQDGNSESFFIPDLNTTIVNGENNFSIPVYNPDQNFSIEFTIDKFNDNSYYTTWYYNFDDGKLYPNIENNTSFKFSPQSTSNLSIDLNNSNFNYYTLNTNFSNNNNGVTKVQYWHWYNNVNRGTIYNVASSINYNYSEEGNYSIVVETNDTQKWYYNPTTGDLNTTFVNTNHYLDLNSSGLVLNIDLNNSNFEFINRTFIGTSGNDILTGTLGDDTIDGGAGIDTAVLSGNQSEYTVTNNNNGTYTITGPDGTDVLTSIEYLNFNDISNVSINTMIVNTTKYFEIEEPVTLTQYENNASIAINIPFDLYWLDSFENFDFNNESVTTTIEVGQILLSNDGTMSEIDKTFDTNSTNKNTYNDMNYTISNNIITIQDSNTSESLFEFKLAKTYTSSELTTIYDNYNMNVNFSSKAVGYKILGKTLKEELEVHDTIFNYELGNSYTSIDTFLNNHTQTYGEYLMSNDINNSKILFFDQNASDQNSTFGNLYEVDIYNQEQIINYNAGTWERKTGSTISYEYDDNGTIISGITNDMILIKPTELGYNYDDAIILGSDGYLHYGSYRDVNATESFIQLNSFGVNDIAKAIVNNPNINATFEGQDNSEAFQNTYLAYDELFYIRTDDVIYQDNNISFDSGNEIFTLTANHKAGEDSRANLRVYFSDKNITTEIGADVNLTDANTSYNKGHMWAVLQDVVVANSNDLNITNNTANIYAGITIKGNGLFSFVTVYDENWTERWTVDNLSEYNTTMLYDSNSSFMINKKVSLNINLDNNNTLIFEAFDENGNQLGNTHYFANQYLTLDAIDRSELRSRVDDRSESAAPTTTMEVHDFFSVQSLSNNTPIFDQNIVSITMNEGVNLVHAFSASDIENDNLTYFIDGLDSSLLNINSTTGELSFNSSPDYDNPIDSGNDNNYNLNINVTDSYSTVTLPITIIIEDTSAPHNNVSLIDIEQWKETITNSTHQFTNNTTHANISLNKTINDLSTVTFYQDNLSPKKEAIAEIELTNIDEHSFVHLKVYHGTYYAILSVSSKEAFATTPEGTILDIYDTDDTSPFIGERLKLNIWMMNNEIYFNITDEKNNQIGRLVQSTSGSMTNFTQHSIIGSIDGTNSTNSSLNFNFYGITSNDSLTMSYYKRLPFIEFKIPTITYDNETALDMNNTKMFEIQTDIDWQDTQYLNLKFGQINPYSDEVLESSVTINHKGIITEDKKEVMSISNNGNIINFEDEEIKYIGTQTTAQMNSALSDANISYTIQNGGGYKIYSKQLQTQCKIHNADTNGNYTTVDDLIYNNTQYNGYSYLTRNNYDNFSVLQFSSTSDTTSGDLVQYNLQDESSSYTTVGTWSIINNVTCTNEDDNTTITIDVIDINTTVAGYEYTDFGYKNGTQYHIEYAQKDETFEMYFFDETTAKELAEDYGLTTTPLKQKVLTDTYNYLSLPSTMTLCNNSFQSALPTICNQDYDIETVFAEADTVFKYTGYWSYWSPNTSIASNQYALNILSSLNNKEGFIVKISDSSKTLNLPYNLYGPLETDLIDLYKTGWFLTGGQIAHGTSKIDTMVQNQGKTLRYMLHLNDNIWNIHAPLNDAEIDSTIPRMNTITAEESFWIYVE